MLSEQVWPRLRGQAGRDSTESRKQRRRVASFLNTRQRMNQVARPVDSDDAARRFLVSRSLCRAQATRSRAASVSFDRARDAFDPRDNKPGTIAESVLDVAR